MIALAEVDALPGHDVDDLIGVVPVQQWLGGLVPPGVADNEGAGADQ